MTEVDPAWLPSHAWRAIGSRRTVVTGSGLLVDTVLDEIASHGELVRHGSGRSRVALSTFDSRLGPDGFTLTRADGVTSVLADSPAGLLYGLFHVVRLGEAAFDADLAAEAHRPAGARRMLDHWDNVDVHPVMGQVERGYAGGSIFWRDGGPARRPDPGRGLRAAAGVVRGQRGRGEQRQRARDRGAAAHRPARRRRRASPTSSARTASGCTCR